MAALLLRKRSVCADDAAASLGYATNGKKEDLPGPRYAEVRSKTWHATNS